MSDTKDDCSFPIPNKFKQAFRNLLLPGECIDDIFDHIGGFNFEEGNQIKLYKCVWGSKIMNSQRKKPRTLDTFFKKVKIENDSDSSESNDQSLLYNKMLEKTKKTVFKETSPDNENRPSKVNEATVIEKKKKKKKKKESNHSISSEDESTHLHKTHSPSYSEDLFSEGESTNHFNPLITKKKKLEQPMPDEDIIPFSQATKNLSRHSLGYLSTGSSMSINSNLTSGEKEEIFKLPKNHSSKRKSSNISDSESFSTRVDSSSEELNWQSSMKNIKEIELDNNKLSRIDLTEDDEVYVLQCPAQVDTKKLEGLKLNLNGDSILSLSNGEHKKYDCVALKENSNRHLYVALPDTDKGGMKIGIIPQAGSVIMTENLDIPFIKPIEGESDYGNQSNSYTNETLHEVPRKHKKKPSYEDSITSTHVSPHKEKHIKTEIETSIDISNESLTEEIFNKSNSTKKKKKHKSFEGESDYGNQSNSYTDDTLHEEPRKHKKKHSSYEDSITSTHVSPHKEKHIKTEIETSIDISNESLTEEIFNKSNSTKKKKKHKSFEGESDYGNQSNSYTDDTLHEEPRKHKKKHSSYEDSITSTHVSPHKEKHIKTEIETSIDISNESLTEEIFNKSNSTKKKRKHKSFEDTEDGAIPTIDICNESLAEEISNKINSTKKKRKHKSFEDETHEEESASECFSETVTDSVINRLSSRKKKKKNHKNIENNEINSSLSDFLNIKTEWEEPQIVSYSQETPSKLKKRKIKELEESTEFTEEEGEVKKKKKKKHSHSESQLVMSPFDV